jgi:1,4-dihydroxy-6-naphthoate synthase
MKLTIGFSPCPNDTYIFDALIHKKIDTEGLDFEVFMADVEELNTLASTGALDITKLSFHAYAWFSSNYQLLTSGSALGEGCGPLLIAKQKIEPVEFPNIKIAIPGVKTTANLLFQLAYPNTGTKQEMLFSKIEDAILNDEVDAGVIIHENRFTYADKGLVKIADLGSIWENKYKMAVPLGGIAIKRQHDSSLKEKVNRLIRKSIEFANQYPDSSLPFTTIHAQEMEQKVMQQHIDLYVNDYSIDLGETGKRAIEEMYQTTKQLAITPPVIHPLFVE